MGQTKKIGLITPTLQSGGAERVISLTSKILTKAGYSVYIIMYDTTKIEYDYSGKIINLKSPARTNLISKIFTRIIRVIKLSYYKKTIGFDFVISFLYSANVVNYLSFGKTRMILSCRGYSDFLLNGSRYAKMINKSEAFIVQTSRMKNDFKEKYKAPSEKIKVLYNPFDIEKINELSQKPIEKSIENFIKKRKVLITMGSFKKDKGHWHLIRSFVKVKKTIANAGLIFIGTNGELENKIKEMALKSGFSEDILFIGHQDNPFKYLSKCDLYVSSSLYEGFPNAIVEAMASGLPIISTDCLTGPREILSESGKNETPFFAEYGVLTHRFSGDLSFDFEIIEPEEIKMADIIIELLNNKQLHQDYKNVAKIRSSDFSLRNYKQNLFNVLR